MRALRRAGRAARLAAVVALIALAGVLGTAGSASASPRSGSIVQSAPKGTSALFCSSGAGGGTAAQQTADLLPIHRWSSVAGGDIHTRLSGGLLGLGDFSQELQRNVLEAGSLAFGNMLWDAGTSMTSAAVNFCFGHSLGVTADHIAADIGRPLLSSGIIALLVVATLIMLIWRAARRSESPWGTLFRSVALLSIFFVMLNGATNTRTVGGQTRFGTFSPGWLITKTYGAISSLASAPASAIAINADNSLNGIVPRSRNALSCQNYTNKLLTDYENAYGRSQAAQYQAGLPMALNAMWMQTGLRAYIDVQFGPIGPNSGSTNTYGLKTYCRLLDGEAGIPITNSTGTGQAQITDSTYQAARSPRLTGTQNDGSLAWITPAQSNTGVDMAMVAWAACDFNAGASGFTVSPQWARVKDPNGSFIFFTSSHHVTPGYCQKWWDTAYGSGYNPGAGPFDWGTSTSAINKATTAAHAPGVQNFLLNFHGDANSSATATALSFALAALVIFVVFTVLSLAVIIAKVALLVMMALSLLVLAVALFPSSGLGKRATAFAKHGFSLILFATGAQVILSLVALITSFLVQAGSSAFGAGSLMEILWTSFAPIGAIWLLHHFFEKVLKAPSPFKPTSALAWGAAAGGVGAGIGAGLESRFNRGRSRAVGMASSGARAGWQKVSGKPRSRLDAMKAPDAGGKKSTAATAAGGAAAASGAATGGAAAAGGNGAGGGAGTAAAAAAVPPSVAGQMSATRKERAAARAYWRDLQAGRVGKNGEAAQGAGAAAAGAATVATGLPGIASQGAGPTTAGNWQQRAKARAYRLPADAGRRVGGSYAAAKTAVSDRAAEAVERFRAKPIRNTLKLAGTAVGIAALPIATAPAMAAAAALYGIHKVRQAKAEHPQRRALAEQRRLGAYRAGLVPQPGSEKPKDAGGESGRPTPTGDPGGQAPPGHTAVPTPTPWMPPAAVPPPVRPPRVLDEARPNLNDPSERGDN